MRTRLPRPAPLRELCLVLAVVGAAVAPLVAEGRQHRDGGVRAAAAIAGGSFAVSNTRDGAPIFRVDAIAPGESVAGTVTVTNTGTLPGKFTLTQRDLIDVPGANGGPLSAQLDLLVSEVTAGRTPATVYAGKLAGMTARQLGTFNGGEARSFHFKASLPDTGTPPSAGGGDNAFAGSSLSITYAWQGIANDIAGRPRRRAATITLRVPRVQGVLRSGDLIAYVRCDEPCRVGASLRGEASRHGYRNLAAPIRTRRIPSGRQVQLKLHLRRATRHSLARSLARHPPVTVRLTVTARNDQGIRSRITRTIRLVRVPRR